ncbi:MAG: type IV pilin [Candidatus Nitrosocaldaceae archaeon]
MNRQKRGVSPVLATMIMVGVTVAVGLGVASYTMGLFGNLSKSANIKIISTDLVASSRQLSLTLDNSGGATVQLTKVTTVIGTNSYSATSTLSIGPSSSASTTLTFSSATFTAGKTYTFTLEFSNGSTLTITTTAR